MDSIIQNSGQLKKEIDLLIPFIEEPWKDFTYNTISQANIEPANESKMQKLSLIIVMPISMIE